MFEKVNTTNIQNIFQIKKHLVGRCFSYQLFFLIKRNGIGLHFTTNIHLYFNYFMHFIEYICVYPQKVVYLQYRNSQNDIS